MDAGLVSHRCAFASRLQHPLSSACGVGAFPYAANGCKPSSALSYPLYSWRGFIRLRVSASIFSRCSACTYAFAWRRSVCTGEGGTAFTGAGTALSCFLYVTPSLPQHAAAAAALKRRISMFSLPGENAACFRRALPRRRACLPYARHLLLPHLRGLLRACGGRICGRTHRWLPGGTAGDGRRSLYALDGKGWFWHERRGTARRLQPTAVHFTTGDLLLAEPVGYTGV